MIFLQKAKRMKMNKWLADLRVIMGDPLAGVCGQEGHPLTVQVDVDSSVLPVELVDPLVDLEHFVEVVLVWGQTVVAVFGSIEYGAYHNPVKRA